MVGICHGVHDVQMLCTGLLTLPATNTWVLFCFKQNRILLFQLPQCKDVFLYGLVGKGVVGIPRTKSEIIPALHNSGYGNPLGTSVAVAAS